MWFKWKWFDVKHLLYLLIRFIKFGNHVHFPETPAYDFYSMQVRNSSASKSFFLLAQLPFKFIFLKQRPWQSCPCLKRLYISLYRKTRQNI